MKAILHNVTSCRQQSLTSIDQTMLLGVWRLCTCVTKADETEPEANEMKPNNCLVCFIGERNIRTLLLQNVVIFRSLFDSLFLFVCFV